MQSTTAAGTPSNELIDQRNTLTARIAHLSGGTVRELPDGSNEILLGGNVLVSGSTTNEVKLAGATRMAEGRTVKLEWAHRPDATVDLDGGKLAGMLSTLAPAAANGSGGVIAQTASSYNAMAQKLADTVNPVYRGGVAPNGTTGQDFFRFTAGTPAAAGLAVVPKDAANIAAGAPNAGGRDGTVAEKISQLGTLKDSPDALWSDTVVALGVKIQGGLQQAVLADLSLTNAAASQQANASVDIDEENVNLLSYQHAYQAAARVMTAIDEALDVLINQTGRVGR